MANHEVYIYTGTGDKNAFVSDSWRGHSFCDVRILQIAKSVLCSLTRTPKSVGFYLKSLNSTVFVYIILVLMLFMI